MAEKALIYISGEAELLSQFLTESGTAPADLRAALTQAEGCAAMLEFMVQDDQRLIDFARWMQIRPEEIMRARTQLAGPGSYGWEAD